MKRKRIGIKTLTGGEKLRTFEHRIFKIIFKEDPEIDEAE
jgi:hypothetical protein